MTTYEMSLCCSVGNQLPTCRLDNFLLSMQCVDLLHDIRNFHPYTSDSWKSINSTNITRNWITSYLCVCVCVFLCVCVPHCTVDEIMRASRAYGRSKGNDDYCTHIPQRREFRCCLWARPGSCTAHTNGKYSTLRTPVLTNSKLYCGHSWLFVLVYYVYLTRFNHMSNCKALQSSRTIWMLCFKLIWDNLAALDKTWHNVILHCLLSQVTGSVHKEAIMGLDLVGSILMEAGTVPNAVLPLLLLLLLLLLQLVLLLLLQIDSHKDHFTSLIPIISCHF